MRIAFCWTNGVKNTETFSHWNDGLRAAMRLIEKEHEVTYHEPDEDLPEVDWILFWEAPITYQSPENGFAYRKVMNSPQKKALLFAGGPVKYEWVRGFNHIFVESAISEQDFAAISMPFSRAFGVNTDVFKPIKAKKTYTTVTHGTCASWKRQWLVCDALGREALVFGRPQDTDPRPFDDCRKCGSSVLLEQDYEETNVLLNSARVGVNCADYWGGGQRSTLECMAAGLPVVVMEDSPKNREFVEESGIGAVVPPDPNMIRLAVEGLKNNRRDTRAYVMKKWTPEHYKNAILNAL